MQEKEEKQHTKKDIYKILMLANFLKIDLQLHEAVALQYQNKNSVWAPLAQVSGSGVILSRVHGLDKKGWQAQPTGCKENSKA